MREMIVNRNEKFAAFENEIHTLKLRLSKNIEDNKTLTTTMDVWKKETKYKEDKYIEEIVDLKKQKKDLDNIVYKVGQSVQTMHMLTKPQVFYDENHKTALGYQKPFYLRKAQRIQPLLYDGTVLAKKHDVISVIDSEETLILTEDKQAFWLPISKSVSEKLMVQPVPVKTNVPRELPTITKLKGKDTTISNLKKHIANLKEKAAADCSEFVNNSRLIAPGMYKLDVQPFSSTLRQNKEVHEDYMKVTKEHADTLRGIVEHARALEPSDNALDYAYSEKPTVAKTKNRNRRVTSEDKRDTSATKTQKQVEPHSEQTTNKSLLPSTRVISSTRASGSKSKSNTKKNRITQAASSNQKNKKVEDHPRSIMSSSNKKNRVSICNASTKRVVLDVNSKFVCSTCNDCLFFANHDKCVVAYLNDVNRVLNLSLVRALRKNRKLLAKYLLVLDIGGYL
ncbi:hypothetical protein Tco_0466487 [Tanacetum coccineum]